MIRLNETEAEIYRVNGDAGLRMLWVKELEKLRKTDPRAFEQQLHLMWTLTGAHRTAAGNCVDIRPLAVSR